MKLTKEEKKLIGQRIKQIRREKGMTMEEFGNFYVEEYIKNKSI